MADKFDETKDKATDAMGGTDKAKDGMQSAADKADRETVGANQTRSQGQDAASTARRMEERSNPDATRRHVVPTT